MKIILPEKTLMAAWKYDRPPYYSMGEVIGMYEDGRVTIRDYTGYAFHPVKIMPYDEDKIQALKEIEIEYHNENRNLLDTTKDKAQKLLGLKQ